jgi:hypothetical protein
MTGDEIVNAITNGEIKTVADLYAKNDPWVYNYFKKPIPNGDMDAWKPIDLSQLPKFDYHPAKVLDDIRHSLLHIGVLIALLLVLFYFSYRAFIRYDVR